MIKHQQKERKKKSVTEKLFYKIGEVSRITGVEAYVLRYWETEFSFLRPRKSRSSLATPLFSATSWLFEICVTGGVEKLYKNILSFK